MILTVFDEKTYTCKDTIYKKDKQMDNRLDFITEIEAVGIDLMTQIRKAYMEIDEVLRHFSANHVNPLDAASSRTLALARTNLETSLQYAIKTLCLQYEMKPE